MDNIKNILIVEDDQQLKNSVVRILKNLKINGVVDWVSSVESAEKLLTESKYDLIISDYTLCGFKNGLDLWQHCLHKYPATPLILISGVLSIEKFLSQIEKGSAAPPFLPKPFSINEFSSLIARFI